MQDNNNTMANILKFIGNLEIICGIILGIYLGDLFRTGYYGYDFNIALCVAVIVTGIITGIFILGFGEVVQLLQDIKNNTKNSNNISSNEIPKL